MERKTIGGFIAALRRANGMTQKDLAERLNVSDKTVSRWERDDGAPDLSLIPVIAEIFGVTCDELLRGERRPPDQRSNTTEEADAAPKAEKQRRRLLKSAMTQYKNRTYIAMGVSIVGLMAALLCNFEFYRGILGFYIGAAFFAVSAVCQAVFVNMALSSVEDAELDADALSDYRKSVIRLAKRSVALTVGLLGFTLPMASLTSYAGMRAGSLLVFGAVGAAAMLAAYAVVLHFLNASLVKKGEYSLSEKEAARYQHNKKLKRRCAIALAVLLAVTAVVHYTTTRIWGPGSIMKGTTFDDYESFIDYMEQDIPAQPQYGYGGTDSIAEPAEGSIQYYDQYGNEITEEEALTRRLEDRNGNVVCEYVDRNESVISVRYTPKDGTILPITICTQDDLRRAERTAGVRHVIFAAAYCIECFAALLFYFIKRAK